MVKIEKVEFNAEETEIIEKFFEIIEELYSLNLEAMENDIFNIDRLLENFFYRNPNVILKSDEEITEE